MDFVIVSLMFGLLLFGLVFVVQGIIGGEPSFNHQHLPVTGQILETQVVHPPERHRVRLILIGSGIMISAVVVGVLFL